MATMAEFVVNLQVERTATQIVGGTFGAILFPEPFAIVRVLTRVVAPLSFHPTFFEMIFSVDGDTVQRWRGRV
jgi:hypothetical protein